MVLVLFFYIPGFSDLGNHIKSPLQVSIEGSVTDRNRQPSSGEPPRWYKTHGSGYAVRAN